ncbi:MAG: replication associated protein [Circoviridae sp.]|nr:MAG: replication associated protein [Circoviridae sp.]
MSTIIIIFRNVRGMPKNSPIALFDITIPIHLYSVINLQDILRKIGKRWTFQTEEGKEDGYKHYQVRLSLKVRKRLSTIKHEIANGKGMILGHITPTSNPTFYQGDMFYVMKEDTRIAGPWSDTDDVKVMTKQLTWFLKQPLRKFQEDIIREAKTFDMRKIDLIWDTTGKCGKSLLSEYMEYIGIAEEVPPYRLMDDIFQWVCSRGIKHGFKKSYIVDMPRGMKKDKLGDFYSGIEVIKNGVAYDKRNKATKMRFDRPRVFIFTNTLPSFTLMSADRWIVWKIKKDFTYEIINT